MTNSMIVILITISTDLIVYIIGETEITFYSEIFNSTSGLFEQFQTLFSIDSNYLVINLFVNSLEPNTMIDFILTVAHKATPKQHNTFFFRETSKGVYTKHSFEIINSPIFIADLDGDRYIDILFFDEESELRKILNFRPIFGKDFNLTDFELFFDNQQKCIENNRFISKRFDVNGANAFIDVDADCNNDLLLTSIDEKGNKILEIWQGRNINSTIKYCLGKEGVINLDNTLGAFTLGDFNNDGYIDLIFPILGSTNVDVVLNQYTPDFEWTSNYCETHLSDKVIRNIYNFYNTTSHKTITLPSNNTNDQFFISPISSTILRLGAFNSEPYPGIITIIKSNDEKTLVNLYETHYDKEENNTNQLSFKLIESFDVPQVLYASFFDFDDNGQLDIIICSENTNNKSIAYFNNYQHDSFFVKAQTMLQKQQFYSMEIGSHYRFIATNNDGTRRMDMTWQLIQTTNLALNVPYALAGIGRSNNYIENFQVISAVIDNGKNTKSFTPIIPNSQLIITKRIKNKSIKWDIDLIVKPMDQLLIIIIVTGFILLLICIIIFFLHLNELKEDRMN